MTDPVKPAAELNEVQTATEQAAPEAPMTFEELAAKKGTEQWLISGMRQQFKVGVGKVVSEEDFDKWAKEVSDAPIGVVPSPSK